MIALGALLLISAIIWLWEGYPLISSLSDLTFERQIFSHPWESFWFQHVTPPMTTMLNSFIFFFGKWQLYVLLMLRLSTMLLGFALIFLVCCDMGAGVGISFFFSLGHAITSMRIQPADWFGHDTPVYFFLPLFIWSMVKFIRETPQAWGWWVAFSAGALVMTSSVPGLVAVALCLLLVLYQKKIPLSFARHAAPVLIPVLMIGFLCFKNYLNVGVFTLATKGGQNSLPFVRIITDLDMIPDLAQKAKVPDWWIMCYKGSDSEQKKMSGLCYDYYGPYMSPNYSALRQELAMQPQSKVSQAIALDEADESKRPWIFGAGEAFNCGRRFNVLYNCESEKIWQSFLVHHPVTVVYFVLNFTNKFFNYDGPQYQWLHFKDKRMAVLNSWVGMVMTNFYWIGIGVAYLMVLGLIINMTKFFPPGRILISPVPLMALGYCLTNILYVISTCCDQARYFWLAEPFLIPLLAWMLQWVIKTPGGLFNI